MQMLKEVFSQLITIDLWKALEENSPTDGSAESLKKWEKIRKRARAF